MTDPAPVLRREVDALIQKQITTLNQAKPLTESELADFCARSEKIRALFKGMDLSKPLPGEPVRKRNFACPYPSV
jgi:hypothetical protein